MYALQLTESYCPAQTDEELHDSSVGSILRATAAKWPDAPVLQEVVGDGAVVGVPDARMGEAVAAFVRMASGASLDPPTLIAHCRANIAAQKTPTHWIEVSEWPLTGSGKIQKFALRDQWVAGEFA